jgi:hypothetical protein
MVKVNNNQKQLSIFENTFYLDKTITLNQTINYKDNEFKDKKVKLKVTTPFSNDTENTEILQNSFLTISGKITFDCVEQVIEYIEAFHQNLKKLALETEAEKIIISQIKEFENMLEVGGGG